jgi:hypothetical protein
MFLNMPAIVPCQKSQVVEMTTRLGNGMPVNIERLMVRIVLAKSSKCNLHTPYARERLLSHRRRDGLSLMLPRSKLGPTSQSWNFLFSFSPNSVTLMDGRACDSRSLRRSSKVLLMSILPPVPTIMAPPALLFVSLGTSLQCSFD